MDLFQKGFVNPFCNEHQGAFPLRNVHINRETTPTKEMVEYYEPIIEKERNQAKELVEKINTFRDKIYLFAMKERLFEIQNSFQSAKISETEKQTIEVTSIKMDKEDVFKLQQISYFYRCLLTVEAQRNGTILIKFIF